MSANPSVQKNLRIRNGRVLDPANGIDRVTDVFVSRGRIKGLGDVAPDGFTPDQTIDASDCWIIPGIVDLTARLREPGQPHKATIASEALAACSAGVTAVCVPPDTDPVIDTPAVVEWIRHRAEPHALRVYTLGALTRGLAGEQISEMAALSEAGCVGVSNAGRPVHDMAVLRHTLEYAATVGLTVFLHAQDPHLKGQGCAHEGPVATRLGLAGIPVAAETAAVATYLTLAEQTGARVHLCRLSTARAVEMVAAARKRDLPVSADVAAHQLFLSEMDVSGFNNLCHVEPPLRSHEDREALREAVRQGVVSAICSDHQPHEADAKINPFPLTEPGISALETLLPLGLRLVEERLLEASQMIERLSAAPARILGVEGGTLAIGARADLCVVDPDAIWELTPSQLLSAGKHTPFGGWEFRGRVTHTVVGGGLAFPRD